MLDFDTSASIKGTRTVAELGDELLNYLLRVCNGETVKASSNKALNMAINQLGSYC